MIICLLQTCVLGYRCSICNKFWIFLLSPLITQYNTYSNNTLLFRFVAIKIIVKTPMLFCCLIYTSTHYSIFLISILLHWSLTFSWDPRSSPHQFPAHRSNQQELSQILCGWIWMSRCVQMCVCVRGKCEILDIWLGDHTDAVVRLVCRSDRWYNRLNGAFHLKKIPKFHCKDFNFVLKFWGSRSLTLYFPRRLETT